MKDPAVPHATKMAMARAVAEASEAAWEAILEMDAPKLGRALSDTMDAWGSMLPYTTDPYLGTQYGPACEREAPRVQGSAAVDGRTAAAAVSI